MEEIVRRVLAAVAGRDWEGLRLLLHPYLHWTENGTTLRGRRRVLARLVEGSGVGWPEACEVRDGQVYRWVVGPKISEVERR